MATYRIICTVQEPISQPTNHAHIVQVGIGSTPNHYDTKWTLAQVISAIARGDTFYTLGSISGKRAGVETVACRHCGRTHSFDC